MTALGSDGSDIVDLPRLEADAVSNGALGLYLDRSQAVVVVPAASATAYRMPPSAAGKSVTIRYVDMSSAMLQEIRSDLRAFTSTWPRSFGYAFFLDLQSGTVIVQTDAPESVFGPITTRFPGHVVVQGNAIGGLAGNRQSDTPAYWGGSAIYTPIPCSSGFMAKAHGGSATYLSTAGHCGAVGATVTTAGSLVVGKITGRDWPTYEIEWINGGLYQPVIYNGSKGDETSHVSVLGLKAAIKGETGYCRTGSVSGRKCDWTVGGTDASFCTADYGLPLKCTDYLNAFSGTTSEKGDSGGPIYYPYNGGALINGSIVGFWCTILGCINYGEKATSALGRWNLDLVCSGTCTNR